MKRLVIFLFLLFDLIAASSQQTIKGRVVNAATGAPIPGSSVFISSTSKGTVTDNAGTFSLTDVPVGKHELVISSIGYETNVFSFSDGQLPLQLKVELSIKVKELENVTIEPSVEEGWDKWGKAFMTNFVGNTPNAEHCSIKNEKSIKFRYYKKSNRLIAYCDEPVLMENKALGYTIKYQLENFEINYKEGSTSYLGYPYFEPMDNNNKGRQEKWEKKRMQAYNGSIMHFMRSLYANHLVEEGFEVRRMVRVPNDEKERIKKIYSARKIVRQNGGSGVSIVEMNRDGLSPDTLAYYESVLRQENYRDFISPALLTADSLVLETTTAFKAISFDDYLYITYRNELEEPAYLLTQYPSRKATYQRSYVTLLNDKIISLDKSGNYFDPQEFLTSAYWGWNEKMANSLPLDYEPQVK